MSDNSLGKSIKRRRSELGLTQAKLAEKIGVSAGIISNWELGHRHPREENRRKLEEVLELLVGLSPDAADDDKFNPATVEDARRRTEQLITHRRGQRKFRESLLKAYERKCAITECVVQDVLEAAHIYPYRGEDTNHVSNGLLLRADIHTLFDCGLITIDPDSFKVVVKAELRNNGYGKYHDRPLREPKNRARKPNKQALKQRFDDFSFS
ncbi:MAG: helix-turn-helix domain-containing protein [Gammaproteobacteria bacterium]|nr:helix-turn-helix domain-containing protein [Gammaproteobacteria bacterium]